MTPTQKKISMPDNLSNKDIDSIVFVFSKMSIASKHDFIAALMVEHPEHFRKITKALGSDYKKTMVMA